MIRESYAFLSGEALQSNYQLLREMVPDAAFFCPMVKCNAYGHGDVEVAKRLQSFGCERVGVVSAEEAITLRRNGITMDILIFGHVAETGWPAVQEGGFTPVISSLRELRQMQSFGGDFKFHMKFNTGINRLGVRKEDLEEVRALISTMNPERFAGLCTHLAQAWDVGSGAVSEEQVRSFLQIRQEFAQYDLATHALNSMGLFRYDSHSPEQIKVLGARPGLALYGVALPEFGSKAQGLTPVMTVLSKVIHVQKIKKGEGVSYDSVWTAPRDSVIGVVPIGYGDGLPWSLVGKGEVLLGGERVPMVGRICMDHIMLDVTDHYQGERIFEEEVEIFGPNLLLQDLAERAGNTTPYEVMTGLSSRLERHWERVAP